MSADDQDDQDLSQIDRTIPVTIADQLRREILNGDLPPGTTIKERDNADRLGISRTPLREAVRILAKEGLVTLRPLRSPIVAAPTMDEVRDEIAVMRMLELMSGELACRNATDAEISHIRDMAQQVEQLYFSADKVDVFGLDMAMHSAIVAASHNAALARTHSEYLRRLWRIRFMSARRRDDANRTLGDHAGIIDALSRRDEADIRRHLDNHMNGMLGNIEAHFRAATLPD
ncbi:GntR family transcriptional regulator [Paracoccus tegillarcae]|uniref:GntR family transcriptional regulator n=1 Tax=Paracoccus tegillarcae TaxID=1529068 RepID=A0A2K9ERU0_9RHOB|nr:GntR family transcriptional regulator [Paracoccus tegillarcae]AUH33516.1 GntR family transcriptional regulator [Paracoccus tegillarcae]